MEMTFKQYIENPLGKRNAVFSQRDMYKALYSDKFDKLFLREAGKINFKMYYDDNDKFYIHIKIPSEGIKNFYYDAVIMFYTNDAAVHSQPTLENYNVKFFSNDPAFVFTYLRVFLKNDLFFEDLKVKSSKLALKEDPKQTNPYQIPGYSKILYFTYLFMKMKNLFAKYMYKTYGSKYNKKDFLKKVMHTDEKIALREELGKKEAAEKRKEEIKERKEELKRDNIQKNVSKSSNKIGLVKSTKSVKSTSSVKTTRKATKK